MKEAGIHQSFHRQENERQSRDSRLYTRRTIADEDAWRSGERQFIEHI